jgi:hypothetical protein
MPPDESEGNGRTQILDDLRQGMLELGHIRISLSGSALLTNSRAFAMARRAFAKRAYHTAHSAKLLRKLSSRASSSRGY